MQNQMCWWKSNLCRTTWLSSGPPWEGGTGAGAAFSCKYWWINLGSSQRASQGMSLLLLSPCPVSSWVCSCCLQPGWAPVHCSSTAVSADCLWCYKLDYGGVCQCFGFSKCLPILETSAASQLLQAWPARLANQKIVSLWIIWLNIPAHKSRWLFI